MYITPHMERRFPLVARSRPACLPLNERVGELERLADTAGQDPTRVSAVLNQAALLAYDMGMPDLARTWCHGHARAQSTRLPGTAKTAIHALEPIVNLARLLIRNGDGQGALHLLHTLFEAVINQTDTEVDAGLVVPGAELTTTEEEHQTVVRWVWKVLLADGTRALITAGRWTQALEHLRAHNGIGNRMGDGRQVAVIAHLVTGEPDKAHALVEATTPGKPWEEAVTALLGALCRPGPAQIEAMVAHYNALEWDPATAVFHTRLGLTVCDVLGEQDQRSLQVWEHLAHLVLDVGNGYCARELVMVAPSTRRQTQERLATLIQECGLGAGTPNGVLDRLEGLVRVCSQVLGASDRGMDVA